MRKKVRAVLLAGAVGCTIAGMLVPSSANAQSGARGVTDSTIKVAGLGLCRTARGQRHRCTSPVRAANRDGELPGGRKIEFAEFADDKADPTTALSEARRLVQQEGVFAIVPTLSPNLGQGEFFDQQHVPYFGWGLAFSYCHPGYGSAVSGCLLPETPTTTADNWARTMTTYYKEHKRPKPWSVALVQEDTPAGKTSTAIVLAQFQDNGFKVTYAKPSMPGPPRSSATSAPTSTPSSPATTAKRPASSSYRWDPRTRRVREGAEGGGLHRRHLTRLLRPTDRRSPQGHARHHTVRTVRERRTGDENSSSQTSKRSSLTRRSPSRSKPAICQRGHVHQGHAEGRQEPDPEKLQEGSRRR